MLPASFIDGRGYTSCQFGTNEMQDTVQIEMELKVVNKLFVILGVEEEIPILHHHRHPLLHLHLHR